MLFNTQTRAKKRISPNGIIYSPIQNIVQFSPRVRLNYDPISHPNQSLDINHLNNPQIRKPEQEKHQKNRTFEYLAQKAPLPRLSYTGSPVFEKPKILSPNRNSISNITFTSSPLHNPQYLSRQATKLTTVSQTTFGQQIKNPVKKQISASNNKTFQPLYKRNSSAFEINLPSASFSVQLNSLRQEQAKSKIWDKFNQEPGKDCDAESQKQLKTENKVQSLSEGPFQWSESKIQNTKKYSQVSQATCNKKNSQDQTKLSKRNYQGKKVASLIEKSVKDEQINERLKQFQYNSQKFQISHLKSEINRIKFQNQQLKQTNKRYLDRINRLRDLQILEPSQKINMENQKQMTQKIAELEKMVVCQRQQILQIFLQKSQNVKLIQTLNDDIKIKQNQTKILQSQLTLQKIESTQIIQNLKNEMKVMQNQIQILKQEIKTREQFERQIKAVNSSILLKDQDMHASNIDSAYGDLLQKQSNKMKMSQCSIKSGYGLARPQECYFQILDIFGIQRENQNSFNILISQITQIKKHLQDLFVKCRNYETEKIWLSEQLREILINDQVSAEKRIVDCINLLKNDE